MQYRKEKKVCNGKFKLITDLNEFKMALWINGFGLENAFTGEEIIPVIKIFNLDDIEEVDGEFLKIKFRIYPDGSKYYAVEIHPFLKSFVYENETYSTDVFFKTITGEEWE
ncbi:hypothetical protein [Chryseobacterium luquanense]|uniref:Uncharacterized protein n=1 Tax=Chryseobacterium luquanense TaxID=2983766 RepID=A0ABT3Y4R0_9FLAO|nr:hypothetical protein [Chryseobacterium luquanense]MCX8533143.1 hypothetical protein [Chryseobacterium luquanense]